MGIESEVLNWLSPPAQSLQVIGQRMIEQAARGPGCSYRWCVRDVILGITHEYNPETRSPASSTRKLFILLAVLRLVEIGEWALEDELLVDNRKSGLQTCGSLWLLDSPRAFTVAELLKLMMGLSDNVATFYLVEQLTLERLNELSTLLQLSATTHLSAVPSQTLSADHPLSVVNTTSAGDLMSALMLLVEGAQGLLPTGATYISRELCKFGLHIMRGQQDTTAIRSWLTDLEHVGDKHGIGYRNYNNVGYLAHGGRVQLTFSVIVDDLHRIQEPLPAFAHARDFIALFARQLDDYCRRDHSLEEL